MYYKQKRRNKMKKNKYDQPIEHSDEYYYCLLNKSRRILLYADIDSNSAYVVNFKLNAFAIEKQNEPIILEINSDGGFVNDGFAIIDTIAHLKCPVYTLVRGQVCSMASLISIVGTKRFITENSYWMQHSAAEAVADYLQHIKDRTKYLERVETQMTELMKEKQN